MELPSAFLNAMQTLLGEEYLSFLECWQGTAHRGLRRNPLKCGEAQLRDALPFPIEPTAFSPLSYRFNAGEEGVGRLPAHHAGLFYVQEPSACSAVTALDPQPGERVLATDGVLVGEAYRTSADSWYRAYDAAWRKFGSKVTHWMPMPEAPEKEDKP